MLCFDILSLCPVTTLFLRHMLVYYSVFWWCWFILLRHDTRAQGHGADLTSNSTSSSNSWWIIVMCKSFLAAVLIKIYYVSTFFRSALLQLFLLLMHLPTFEWIYTRLSTIWCFGGVGLHSGIIRGQRGIELTWQVIHSMSLSNS